jgi:hypothetical protein
MAENPSSETISDIQNYLQSFNKEIGESGDNESAFYAIDTQKLAQGIDDGTLQMLAEQAATGHTASTSGAPDAGYQTVAIVPDGDSGGYVLIVQQPQTSDANDTPVTTQTTTSAKSAGSAAKSTPKSAKQMTRIKRIKQEKKDASDRPNDISVYDFDDINLPNVAEDETINELDNTEALLNDEEVDEADVDVKPNITPKTPKRQKKAATGTVSAKKAKTATPATPSNPNQHMCNYCNYTSNKRYLLSRHMKSHSEERPHKCGICERGFKVCILSSLSSSSVPFVMR